MPGSEENGSLALAFSLLSHPAINKTLCPIKYKPTAEPKSHTAQRMKSCDEPIMRHATFPAS